MFHSWMNLMEFRHLGLNFKHVEHFGGQMPNGFDRRRQQLLKFHLSYESECNTASMYPLSNVIQSNLD
jgi:hypothetical protein